MPSVGSTPTTTSPAQQQQRASNQQKSNGQHKHNLQQQNSLPLQLQYQAYQPQQQQQQQQQQSTPSHVTTTQPAPAGVFNGSSSNQMAANAGDVSPISTSNSFSSVDTNQTLLHTFVQPTTAMSQQQQHQHHRHHGYRSKYSQFMIITPAVSIDRDFIEYEASQATANGDDHDYEDLYAAANNGNNIFRMSLLQRSHTRGGGSSGSNDSGSHSSENSSSLRSNYNPYIHHSRQHLLSKNTGGGNGRTGGASHAFYAFSPTSWRWCTLICAAMRCFGVAAGGSRGTNLHHPYSSSFLPRQTTGVAAAYNQRGRSSAAQTCAVPHQRLREAPSTPSATSFAAENTYEHFAAAPFKLRKTRDHMNNITYEL